jgi:hypothetical protein
MTTATKEKPKKFKPPTKRWTPMFDHDEQIRLIKSDARFKVVVAGARSGKTEIHKREGILEALKHPLTDARMVFAAPTRDQAKDIYWADLKKLVNPQWLARQPRETELLIEFKHGPSIRVVGMDKPQRIEGKPIDWVCMDEYRDMKREAWESKVQPMLSTPGRPPGKARLIGRPGPMNHFYDLYIKAKDPEMVEWDSFHWPSSDIMPAAEIASAKSRMDPLVFQREYGAEFINYEGRIYYPFSRDTHGGESLSYDPTLDLCFCFDFNRSPGVALICQEQEYKGNNPKVAQRITAFIGEVYIPRHSTTPAICRKLIQDWEHHTRTIYVYGDATGGAKGSAKTEGSDWENVKRFLALGFKNNKIYYKVPKANPRERVRVNSINARLESADEKIHLLVDRKRCPRLIDDFERVVALEGGAGEIDKDSDLTATHLTDAAGYYIHREHPLKERTFVAEAI